jgi:hypothetical protein
MDKKWPGLSKNLYFAGATGDDDRKFILEIWLEIISVI